MKKLIYCLYLSVTFAFAKAENTNTIGLLPLPVEWSQGNGEFIIAPNTPLIIKASTIDKERLATYASKYFSVDTTSNDISALRGIKLIHNPEIISTIPSEGYRLSIDNSSATVEAPDGAGLFYGLQTLIQLADGTDKLPEIEITDYPRFGYRGIMLDISRHFRDKEFIKKQIDALARLKINRLHLHLTDAAGWRIEIKQYPELTQYAAWRPQETWKEWNDGGNNYINGNSAFAHGGFLTQDDAKEIVQYAADRYITVIPEIEMPSHSEEVTTTFPQLSCTHGRQPDVCVGNDSTFIFFKNILDEIIDIFPSEYIHIGGDEASKQAWKDCEKCLKLMKNENLATVEELQSYMIENIEKYLNSKGRKIIGWDEILEGNPTPTSTIMTWRGIETGIEAAKNGHKVIMSPGAYCYLDAYQDAPATQPEAISGYTPLSKVYSYNPVPDSIAPLVGEYIAGIQGNLWCEYIPTAQHAEYMLYPRATAIAEIGWTPQENRSWDNFLLRVLKYNNKLQQEGYHVFDISHEVGNRREALIVAEHLGKGKNVTYNIPWWRRYNAAFEKTLTDGERGGWSYSDGKWQGFVRGDDKRLDVVIDLEKPTDIKYIGADFMQIIGPGVWLPEKVVISVSADGENFTELTTIEHPQTPTSGLSFKTYSWDGHVEAQYVRYVADSSQGCLFTDEIIIE